MELYGPGPMGGPPIVRPKQMENPILTNVRHLTFISEEPTDDLHSVFQLITPSIEHLEIIAEDGYRDLHYRPVLNGEAIKNLADTIAAQSMPKLRHFRCSAYLRDEDWPILARLVGSLPDLESLDLSDIPLNQSIVGALFKLPKLRVLDLICDIVSRTKAEELLFSVVQACPSIETITIRITKELWTNSQGSILCCLFPLSLRDLTIYTARPTTLTRNHVVMIRQAWPQLKRFQMRSDDGVNPLQSPWEVLVGTPLAVLLHFADTFNSNLKELHADFTFGDQGQVPLPSEAKIKFKDLETLRFGAFRVFPDKYVDVGRFLAAICPPGVRLEMTPRRCECSDGKHYEGSIEHADNVERERSRIAISEVMREARSDL